jgi:hypothetical protein
MHKNSSIRHKILQKIHEQFTQLRETKEERYSCACTVYVARHEDARLRTFLASALQAMAERSVTTLGSLYQYHFGHHALPEILFVYTSYRGYTQQAVCIKYRLFSFTICYLKSFFITCLLLNATVWNFKSFSMHLGICFSCYNMFHVMSPNIPNVMQKKKM